MLVERLVRICVQVQGLIVVVVMFNDLHVLDGMSELPGRLAQPVWRDHEQGLPDHGRQQKKCSGALRHAWMLHQI